MTTDEILVVGAGPVGLTAACQLARLGVPVRLIDALETPTTESRAVLLHARSMEMLAALGVLDELHERGRRVDAMEMTDGATGTTRMRMDFAAVPSRHPYMLDLPQTDTEAVLAERAAALGVVVQRGVALSGLRQDADGVEVTLRSGDGEQTVRVGWVVGTDGAHSTTRHLIGAHLEGGFHGQRFAMADVEVDTSYPKDAWRTFLHPHGVAILFPLKGDRARLVFLVDDTETDAPTLERVQELADARMGGRVTVRDPHWLTSFEVHHAQVPRYCHDRVLLAGDAAHIHSPAGAQGMNTGVQDAANLAWKLALVARGQADPELLDTYHDERHPVGAAVVRATTRITDAGTATGPKALMRDLALHLVGNLPGLARVGAATMAETTVGYRTSSLSVEHGHRAHGGARAGDHAPDPDGVTRPDGTPVTTEDLLARPGFLLLVRGGTAAAVDDLRRTVGNLGTVVDVGEDVLDPGDALCHAYGWDADGMALVRPDGYVGLVADTADAGVLRNYFADTLRVTAPTTV